jgi:hypothetical protein
MKVMRAETGKAVYVGLNVISFRSLIRALRILPGLRVEQVVHHPASDEALAVFWYKGFRFEISTPLTDYFIDRPRDCPVDIFDEVVGALERFQVHWWHHFI